MKVKLNPKNTDTADYTDLTPGKLYQVIGIEADDLRILNDEGLPYLYARDLFVIADASEPENWETSKGEEGERYSYPKELSQPGFFEDYFDGDPCAISIFRNYLAATERNSSGMKRS